MKEVSHPEDRDVTDADRARIRSGEIDQARFEKRYLRRDGSVVWCDLAIALVRDVFGMPLYEIAVFDDITERKQSEAALQRRARGAEKKQRGAGAVRLCRLARPAGAAAHGGELHPAARAALRSQARPGRARVHVLHRRRRDAHEAADRGPARLLARRHQGPGLQAGGARGRRCAGRSSTCAPASRRRAPR